MVLLPNRVPGPLIVTECQPLRGRSDGWSHYCAMSSRTGLPPNLSKDGFTVREAIVAGVSTSRLRGRDLESPFWGVRSAAGSTADVASKAHAFIARAGELAILSHLSAARLWGIPLPARCERDERLHVSVPPDRRAPKARGVAGHHVALHPTDVVPRLGVRTTSQARTLCDLASILAEEELLAAADYLLWWRRDDEDRVARDEIMRVMARHPTSRGMARLRSVIPVATDRADSPPESQIRFRILKAALPAPNVNLELFDSRGRFLAMPDLSYPDFRVAIDYEGDHHRTDPKQWEKDINRVPRLQDADWHHTRVSRSDLRNSDDFLARLGRNLRERGWNP
jgi:hypothetical protein